MSELTEAAIKKLKVAELKAELSKRGLSNKGKKDELAQRLLEAVQEGGEDAEPEAVEDGDEDASADEENHEPDISQDTEESMDARPEESVAVQNGDEEMPEEPQKSKSADSGQKKEVEIESPPASDTEEKETADVAMADEDVKPAEAKADAKAEASEESKKEDKKERKEGNLKRRHEDDDDEEKEKEKKEEKKEESKKEEEKEMELEEPKIETECEDGEDAEPLDLDENKVALDHYTSDLSFLVSPDGQSGRNLIKNSFCFLWSGVKANFGVKSGKACYECKVVSKQEVELPDTEKPKHGLRVGWSAESSGLQLGEASLSYGYESTGKICASSNFSDYADAFAEGDIIGAYLDLESEPKTLKYTKNGNDLGVAMSLTVNLDDKALFPHLFVKNMEVEVNFGSRETPWHEPLEGYTFVQDLDEDKKMASSFKAPAQKEDCEVLMMVGLPSSGKTTWCTKYCKDNADKNYCIIGNNALFERMKLQGQVRKRSTSGYDKLLEASYKCLHKLFSLAPKRKRNYILDQTNVYAAVQKRKMEAFDGFKRKAVVLIPSHDDLRKRNSEKRHKDGGFDLPLGDLLDMKSHFALPKSEDGFYEEISYAELKEEECVKMVKDYHLGGRRAKERRDEPPHKRRRYDDRSRGYGDSRRHDDDRYRRRDDDRYRRRDGPSSGGGRHYDDRRDNRRYDDRRYDNRRGGGYGGYGGYRGGGGYGGGGYGGGGYGGGGYGGGGYGGRGGRGGYSSGSRPLDSFRQQGGRSQYGQRDSGYGSRGGRGGFFSGGSSGGTRGGWSQGYSSSQRGSGYSRGSRGGYQGYGSGGYWGGY